MTPTTSKPQPPANDDFLSSLPTLDALVKRTVTLESGRTAAPLPASIESAMSVAVEAPSATVPSSDLQRPTESTDLQRSTPAYASSAEVDEADDESLAAPMEQERVQRKIVLPIILFLVTCLSTFWVGVTHFQPVQVLPAILTALGGDSIWARRLILEHWPEGLCYMACVMGILLVHELGHFIATVIYRVRASLPMFLPFPFNPIGTFGAVIGMNGGQADRKQLFDIGIAGPLAGLVIAIPVMVIGVMTIDVSAPGSGDLQMNCPLGVSLMIQWLRPDIDLNDGYLWLGHANAWFVAGWVGFLITGLNMMPVSQLDGGHVSYALMGKGAHWVARGVMVLGIGFMFYFEAPTMVLMAFLILIVGTDHPRTRDDSVKLGAFRTVLGWISLSIPILCFPPFIFRMV